MGEGSPGEEPLRSAGMRIEVRQELSIAIGIRVSFLEGGHPTDANVGKTVTRGTDEGVFELPVSISQQKATYYIGVRVLPLSSSISFYLVLFLFFLSLSLSLSLSFYLSSWSTSFCCWPMLRMLVSSAANHNAHGTLKSDFASRRTLFLHEAILKGRHYVGLRFPLF
jgi:hypothetical protein